ncbi:hypothetical protein EYF80_036381 [Liparis tanakae]|uniref:Uncharacterized protein n=1 Tax=Liparis tanakae TaxID=230148 RepID=A0A4Z2GKT0_9TELE|nr:hypothetical protein EYF80_036381 [Liparis tanakae]
MDSITAGSVMSNEESAMKGFGSAQLLSIIPRGSLPTSSPAQSAIPLGAGSCRLQGVYVGSLPSDHAQAVPVPHHGQVRVASPAGGLSVVPALEAAAQHVKFILLLQSVADHSPVPSMLPQKCGWSKGSPLTHFQKLSAADLDQSHRLYNPRKTCGTPAVIRALSFSTSAPSWTLAKSVCLVRQYRRASVQFLGVEMKLYWRYWAEDIFPELRGATGGSSWSQRRLTSVTTSGAIFFPSSKTPGLKKGKILPEKRHRAKVGRSTEGESNARYSSPALSRTVQKPFSGLEVIIPFRLTDSLTTPRSQKVFDPTATSKDQRKERRLRKSRSESSINQSINQSADLEVEPPGQEAVLGQNADDGVEALGVVGHDVKQLAAARLLPVRREDDVGMGGVRVQNHVH